MNSAWIGHLYGVSILVLMTLFLGIWAWAWSRHNKKTFDAAARLPLEADRRVNERASQEARP
ncbi:MULTISPECIES: cbb3-type cytochrome oxidase subunit 3 [Dyella]|uniref:Cbb3-type cytochrome c oxidase subunit 3 n=2 Tax=Dyella TaxID=231454 RepID=A0A4V2NMC1_9GAMM|nr:MULTISPECIES: cbb3-type cytochrome c oxidase subunit 3 [Dyella]TBR39641.1 cbb3-type cytochrome c oxidase subunit 3 [Dyella terrae]TCI12777.1 cbb3-type cytochrome c oxidase subunit 3 [Dyella soli]